MHSPQASVAPRFLLSIDWSKDWKNRAVYLLDTQERCIRPAGASPRETPDRHPWTVASTLAFARSLAVRGTVLLAYDAPLGVPASYFQAAIKLATWSEMRSFVDWLPRACSDTNFLQSGRSAESWRIDREIYPRAAYAVALSSLPPSERAPLNVAKKHEDVRSEALAQLVASRWLSDAGVTLSPEDISAATHDENAFDALVTATAFLRCVHEGTPLSSASIEDPTAEGGILCTGSVNLGLREKVFRYGSAHERTRASSNLVVSKEHACPIPGCTKVFRGSRRGWDSHVQVPAQHPAWHRHVTSGSERKRLFRETFSEFFGG
jgi:hypothetical protein